MNLSGNQFLIIPANLNKKGGSARPSGSSNLEPIAGELDQDNSFIGANRHHGARKDLRDWLEKVNLPYHSPHKFRHGFTIYSLKHAKDIGQLKAISQNLMLENISITDGIYGGLSDADIKEQISSLTENSLPDDTQLLMELVRTNNEMIEKLQEKLS